jgi:hypothetical protein
MPKKLQQRLASGNTDRKFLEAFFENEATTNLNAIVSPF